MTSNDNIVRALLNRDRRPSRQDRVVASLTNLILGFLGGWYLMLAVGVAHHEWLPGLPTIGYWWSVVLVYLLRSAFATVRASEVGR